MATVKGLSRLLSPKRLANSPRGCMTTFVKLNDKWGLKIFSCQYERNRQFADQTLAAKHGLGPHTGTCFDIPIENRVYYAYSTRVADLICPSYRGISELSNNNEINEAISDACDNFGDEIADLTEELENIGISFSDNHAANCGYYNGRLVCIDFGG